MCRPFSNMGYIKNHQFLSYFSFYQITFSKISSRYHHFNIWKKKTNFIMANKIGRVQKLGKQTRNWPDMTNNILTVPAWILFCHNIDDKKIIWNISTHRRKWLEQNQQWMGVWETAKDKQYVIKLLTMIRDIFHCHNKTKQGTMTYSKSDITLYTTFQKPNKSP